MSLVHLSVAFRKDFVTTKKRTKRKDWNWKNWIQTYLNFVEIAHYQKEKEKEKRKKKKKREKEKGKKMRRKKIFQKDFHWIAVRWFDQKRNFPQMYSLNFHFVRTDYSRIFHFDRNDSLKNFPFVQTNWNSKRFVQTVH